MLELARAIPFTWLYRRFKRPRKLPFNLTLSLTYDCNARCRTCNIHNREADPLSTAEWLRVFESLGTSPFWITFSGGEPFLRTDLPEIVTSCYRICRPRVINIPSNGLLTERIPEMTARMAKACPGARLIINLSVDEIGERHDELRGVPGNYDKVMHCYDALKNLDAANLTVGFHTVVSRFNVERIPEIHRHLEQLNPDSLISEIAEERVELDTVGHDIAPSPAAYGRAADWLISQMKHGQRRRAGRVTRAFRREYYRQVKRLLAEGCEIIPCQAGSASAQIAPDGQVWLCCVKAEPVGHLRETEYDFSRIWYSATARAAQREVARTRCRCPLANAAYTNMLFHPRSLGRVVLNLLR